MSAGSYSHRAITPPMTAPISGATQKSQSCPIYSPLANRAGPVLRAGLTEVLLTGIEIKWIKVKVKPIGIPAKPTEAPFEVVPTIMKIKKKVSNASVAKQLSRLYFPGLRSPKPFEAKPPATQPALPEA